MATMSTNFLSFLYIFYLYFLIFDFLKNFPEFGGLWWTLYIVIFYIIFYKLKPYYIKTKQQFDNSEKVGGLLVDRWWTWWTATIN